jgi:hypothetical protein
MVAITVILAAVIGAFVLEIGDQQETAPNTSFSTNEQVITHSAEGNLANAPSNFTQVEFTQAGGDNLDIQQFEVTVNGNENVWGIECIDCGAVNAQHFNAERAEPAPDFRQTLGSNEQVQFKAGQTMDIILSEGIADDDVEAGQVYDISYGAFDVIWFHTPNDFDTHELEAGDSVTVVWEAESGGKTQSIHNYDVQTSSPTEV